MQREANNEKSAFRSLTNKITFVGRAFKQGDFFMKCSYVIMGTSNLIRGQIVKGLMFLLIQLIFISYMANAGINNLIQMTTLGTKQEGWVYNEQLGIDIRQPGDNSMLILLYGVVTIVIIIAFLMVWYANIKSGYNVYQLKKEKKHIPGIIDDIRDLFDVNLHKTFLSIPMLGIVAFTILPLIFMILIAFTNYDSVHQPPGNLFTWVGLDNFDKLLGFGSKIGNTFWPVLQWTLIWAVVATFSTFIGGVLLAMLVNKKNVKGKAVWRTAFIMSIAVPQFVSLLVVRTMLQEQGALNILLKELNIIQESIPFWTDANLARIIIIVVNLWVGIPYTMLTVSGVLMNIPEEYYEAARVDGANKFVMFVKITMPYLMFVMTPSLITGFISNINNFNVIYLLTAGGPNNIEYFQAGKTDLLVTWLYKLTTTGKEYSYASTIGILIFVISAVFSLITYRRTAAYSKEEDFS